MAQSVPTKKQILDTIAQMEKDVKFEPVNEDNQWKWNKGGDYNIVWENFREQES